MNYRLTSYLNEYLAMQTPQFAVMITGKWGCGKTFYIKNLIDEWCNPNRNVSEDSIDLKPIYVSLNGLSSISTVIRKVKTVLYPILYSKGATVAKTVILSALRIASKSFLDLDKDGAGEDMNNLLDAEGIIEVFKSDSDTLKGNRVMILDDVERCKIPLDELFGFINSIVEHSNSKIILICDEEKLDEVANKEGLATEYKDFKEKLVGQTFALEVSYADVAGQFIDKLSNPIINSNRDLIIDLFIASKRENLRLMRHCLIDIKRFFEQIPENIKENSNYDQFVKNIVAYVVIASIETRFGNIGIEYFQAYTFNDEAKKMSQEIEQRYNPILEKWHLYGTSYTIPFKYLIEYVRNGFLASADYLVAECRMLKSRNLTNWEKLWNSYRLSNAEFSELLLNEKKRFYNKELQYVFEVIHLSGILLSLEKRQLTKLNRKHIVRVAKKTIENIINRYNNDFSRIYPDSRGYEFQESNAEEMQEIVDFARDKYIAQLKMVERDYVISVWNELGSDITQKELLDKFKEVTPSRECSYDRKGIFHQVKPELIVKKIIAMSNNSRLEFRWFLMNRYYLEGCGIICNISGEMKEDKDSLERISSMLKSRAKRKRLIEKETIMMISEKIDEAVSKM